MLKSGQVIANRYQVLAEAGGGGMGKVYRTQDNQLNRLAALKVLHESYAYDENFVKRFLREAQSAAGLRHPNIVTIYEANRVDNLHYIAMEFVEGRPLDEIIKDQSRPPLSQVSSWLDQIASALDHAHARGMIHRDVKPANIIVDNDGRVILTDFGIALISDATRLTATGQIGLGTPFYSSPEQITGKEPTPQSDIYSLGAVIYELLAGRPPFEGDTMTLLYSHVHEPPPPIRSKRPDLPAAVENVLNQALAKDSNQRFDSASAFAQAFAASAGITSLQAARPPAPKTARVDAKDFGLVKIIGITAIVVALILVVILASWSLFGASRNGDEVAAEEPGAELTEEAALAPTNTSTSTVTPTPEPTATSTPTEVVVEVSPTVEEPIGPTVVGIAGVKWVSITDNLGLPDGVERKRVAVAADPSGNLAMGWFEPGSGLQVISSADGGESWSGVELVTDVEKEDNLPQLGNHWLRFDEDGNLLATWVKSTDSSKVFNAVSSDGGSTWQSGIVIDDKSRPAAERYGARVVTLGNGQLGIAWVERFNPYDLYFSRSQENNSGWDNGISLMQSSNPIIPGNLNRFEETLYMGFVEKSDQGDRLYVVTSNDLGETWSRPKEISDSSLVRQYSTPRLVAVAQNQLAILVSSVSEAESPRVLFATFDPNDGSPPVLNSIMDVNGEQATTLDRLDLTSDSNDVLYAIWSDDRDGLMRAYLSISEDGETWSTDIPISPGNDPQVGLSLKVGSNGALYVVGNALIGDEDEPLAEIFVSRSEPDPAIELTSIPTATPLPPPTLTPAPPPRTYQLAFSRWDGEDSKLYVADTNGQNEVFIFDRAAGPSFDPNKKRLYFFGEQGVNQQWHRQGENRILCKFDTISDGIVAFDLMSPLSDICDVQFDTWECKREGVDVGQEPSDVCTALSGLSIYQNLDWKEGTARWVSVAPNNLALVYDAIPGGPPQRLYFKDVVGKSGQAAIEILGENASWSPNSEQLVYRSGRDNRQGLWISQRDGTGHISLTVDGTDNFPAWSPNGRTIAFSREVEGNVDIYTMNVDGSNLQRLTEAPGPDTLPVYTPDGSQIIFRSARTGSWGIWKMNSGGAGQVEIIPNADPGPDWASGKMDVR